MVEREAQLQEQAALDDPAREPGIPRVAADRPQQDRVVRGELVEVGLLEDGARLQEVPGAERELGRRDLHPRGPEHLECFGDDLGADAVTGDDGEREGGAI